MPTPHNQANIEQIAKDVLMPGDPLRAKFIAENFLKNAVLVNNVRNMFAYTGYYNDKKITVMASGMGMPSMGIYSYELYKFYNVENIIRVGSAGAYLKELNLFDVVLAEKCFSESSYAKTQNGTSDNVMLSSTQLNQKIINTAAKLNLQLTVGTVHSSDVFYRENGIDDLKNIIDTKGCCCVEMESFALFHNANVLNKNAACLLSISDSLVTKQETTPQQRETAFTDMIKIALESLA
ncbi:MAG: purine-nucleoside phosphorylase [Oscillospiraceae bacterium]